MSPVAVLVPWRDTGQHRAAAWAHLKTRWQAQHPAWRIVEGTCPDGPWRKGLAVTDALNRTKAGVVVVADADVWCDATADAVAAVEAGAPWAVPHSYVRRLTRTATQAILDGGPYGGTLAEQPYKGHAGGGIAVLPADLLRTVPIDPRFAGWGGEDDAWAIALNTLVGNPWRGAAHLWHLWHPPQPRQSRHVGTPASRALCSRYLNARGNPARIRALIAEARAALVDGGDVCASSPASTVVG